MLLKLNVLPLGDNGSLEIMSIIKIIFLIRPENNFILEFALLSVFASPTSQVMPVTNILNFTRYELFSINYIKS